MLPVGVIKAKFRGKWLSWLNEAYANGELKLPTNWSELDWRKVLRQVSRKDWNVRIQGAYRHGKGVAVYLSRYVNGGPIKNHQLSQADDSRVRFTYHDHHDGKKKEMVLPTEHFLTRVLWHVPVHGQHQVRYYGLYSSGASQKWEKIRDSLGVKPVEAAQERATEERRCPKQNRRSPSSAGEAFEV